MKITNCFPLTVFIIDQRPWLPAASSFSSQHHFISHRPAWAEGRKRGKVLEALGQKQSDLIKVEQRAEKRERALKSCFKGPFQSSENGLWKCRWDLRPRSPSSIYFISDTFTFCHLDPMLNLQNNDIEYPDILNPNQAMTQRKKPLYRCKNKWINNILGSIKAGATNMSEEGDHDLWPPKEMLISWLMCPCVFSKQIQQCPAWSQTQVWSAWVVCRGLFPNKYYSRKEKPSVPSCWFKNILCSNLLLSTNPMKRPKPTVKWSGEE